MSEKEKFENPTPRPDLEVEVEQRQERSDLQAADQDSQDSREGTDDLLVQLNEARGEAHDLEDRMLRLAAEFENYKKRMLREKENSFKYAEEGLVKELLPSLDNLERAIEQGRSAQDSSALLEGVEMTYRGLLGSLERFGLKPLDSQGEAFDPNIHEAMAMEASDEAPTNTVINEFQRGYSFKDRLLRAAKVVVSSGPGNGGQ